jgi:formylglycine-generating enzyme required for sulfatase activity
LERRAHRTPWICSAALLVASGAFGCRRDAGPAPTRNDDDALRGPAASNGVPLEGNGPASPGASSVPQPVAPEPATAERSAAQGCPDGMRAIPEGRLWIGSERGKAPPDEHPRFLAHVGAFCLDRTEVTVAAYAACAEAGACEPAHSGPVTCTATGGQRPAHPINCVTWHQAKAYCAFQSARLPTEAEWEYAARGGDDRIFAWGDEPPDGRTCWKHPGACAVGSYPEDAYGLVDMTGNVWEWVADGYGPYPWPSQTNPHKVYRGGSWSRRFDKWMRVRLRNRWAAGESGSHLGFRCARTLEGTPCPGERDGSDARCLLVVLDADCPAGRRWNGVRCAREGEPRCAPSAREVPGYGCVGAAPVPRAAAPSGESAAGETPVMRTRSPQFDADCKTYQPSRPVAYRFEGGTHAARTQAGTAAGCKNRDVGVGWNSSCCP